MSPKPGRKKPTYADHVIDRLMGESPPPPVPSQPVQPVEVEEEAEDDAVAAAPASAPEPQPLGRLGAPKRPTLADTHERKTTWIERDILQEIEEVRARYKGATWIAAINQLLEFGLDMLRAFESGQGPTPRTRRGPGIFSNR